MTRTPPTLEDLVRQPERVTEVAGNAVAGLLAELERLRAVRFGKYVRFVRRAVTETARGGATAGAR